MNAIEWQSINQSNDRYAMETDRNAILFISNKVIWVN